MVLAAAMPGDALASWSKPRTLASGTLSPAAIAANERGDVVAAWTAARGIRVAVSIRGGAFGTAELIPRSNGTNFLIEYLHVDINERRDVAVAWDDNAVVDEETACCDFVVASTRRAGRRFLPAQRLTNPRRTQSNRSMVAVGARGRVAVSWESDCSPRATVGTVGRRLPSSFRIDHSGCTAQIAQPAVVGSGAALFTYATGGLNQRGALRGLRVTRGGSISRRLLHRGLRSDFPNPQVVTADDGERTLVWERQGDRVAEFRLGVLSTKGVLRSRRRGPYPALDALDGSRSGAAVALLNPVFGSRVFMSLRRPGRGFGPATRLPRYVSDAATDAAVSPSGGLLLTWGTSSGVGAAVRRPGGGLGDRMAWRCRRCDTFFELEREREGLSAELGARGNGIVVWRDGTRVRYVRHLGPRR